MLIVTDPPFAVTFAGRVAPLPDRTYGDAAPRPSVSAVMLKSWLPVLVTVKDWGVPVAPQLTKPAGSEGSVPNVRAVVGKSTLPWLPVPLTVTDVGRAEQRTSPVWRATVAG